MSVDETGYGPDKPKPKMGVRTAVMASLEAGKWALDAKFGKRKGVVRKMRDFGILLRYGISYGMVWALIRIRPKST